MVASGKHGDYKILAATIGFTFIVIIKHTQKFEVVK
jgi:hypothetical protein